MWPRTSGDQIDMAVESEYLNSTNVELSSVTLLSGNLNQMVVASACHIISHLKRLVLQTVCTQIHSSRLEWRKGSNR